MFFYQPSGGSKVKGQPIRLLEKIGQSDLNGNLKRWLFAYMRDRKIWVLCWGKHIKWKKVKMGVPQGSVLSPLLFNFFINDIKSSTLIDENYADDLNGATQHVDLSQASRHCRCTLDGGGGILGAGGGARSLSFCCQVHRDSLHSLEQGIWPSSSCHAQRRCHTSGKQSKAAWRHLGPNSLCCYC